MPALIPLLQSVLVWIVTNLLVGLGISFLTYTGFTFALNGIKQYVTNNFNSMPADVFSLLMMAGLGQGIGIIFGAFAFKAALSATSKLTALKKGKS